MTVGFLRRNLKISNSNSKERAYNAFVRPTPEYASSVWDPHVHKNINTVQRRADRFVPSRYRNTSSDNSMLGSLDWPTLEKRDQISRLSRLRKTHSGLVHCLSVQAKLASPPPTPTPASAEVTTGNSDSPQQERSTGAPHFYPEPSGTGTTCPRQQLRPPHLTFLCQGPPQYEKDAVSCGDSKRVI